MNTHMSIWICTLFLLSLWPPPSPSPPLSFFSLPLGLFLSSPCCNSLVLRAKVRRLRVFTGWASNFISTKGKMRQVVREQNSLTFESMAFWWPCFCFVSFCFPFKSFFFYRFTQWIEKSCSDPQPLVIKKSAHCSVCSHPGKQTG